MSIWGWAASCEAVPAGAAVPQRKQPGINGTGADLTLHPQSSHFCFPATGQDSAQGAQAATGHCCTHTLDSSTCRVTAQEQPSQVFRSYQASKSSTDLTLWKYIMGKRKKEIRTEQHSQQQTRPIWQKIPKSFIVLSPFILKTQKTLVDISAPLPTHF